jgi:hypothetical protein
MLSLGFNSSRTKKTPDRPLQDRPRARGLCPSGTLACTLWQRDSAEPDSIAASAWGSGASPSLGLPIYGISGPDPWLPPGYQCLQGLNTRRQAPGHRCSGAPWRHSLGVPLPTAPPRGSRLGRDTRRQSFPRPLRARGLLGPCISPWSRPPSPPRRL